MEIVLKVQRKTRADDKFVLANFGSAYFARKRGISGDLAREIMIKVNRITKQNPNGEVKR